MKNKLGLNW